ncbi:MAG: NINE protein [Clostridiales Family XIII bacterium]|jgi:TM2 domain-containing membrane protein YozV|nr:NINE protein [Clostridiales Family XIII bacterium]
MSTYDDLNKIKELLDAGVLTQEEFDTQKEILLKTSIEEEPEPSQVNQQNSTQPQGNDERKSKLAAGLLGIFLGSLGIHNFYLGNTSKALIQLLVSVVLCWTFIAPIGMAIWGLIEGIMILSGSITTDAKGIPLKE